MKKEEDFRTFVYEIPERIGKIFFPCRSLGRNLVFYSLTVASSILVLRDIERDPNYLEDMEKFRFGEVKEEPFPWRYGLPGKVVNPIMNLFED